MELLELVEFVLAVGNCHKVVVEEDTQVLRLYPLNCYWVLAQETMVYPFFDLFFSLVRLAVVLLVLVDVDVDVGVDVLVVVKEVDL